MDDIERQALMLVGYIYLSCGKTDKAIALLEGARASAPDDPYLPRPLGYAYVRAGRFAQALAEAEKCKAQPGTSPQDRRCALLLKAHALYGLGRDAERRRVVGELLATGGGTEAGHA